MKRSSFLVGGGLAAVAAAAIKWTVVGTLFAIAYDALFPQRMTWEAKTAWSKCDGAIAGSIAWPANPIAACEAMHMCANEASLNPRQSLALESAMGRLAACPPP